MDRLVKDIITESVSFDIESFIPLLHKQIKKTKPYVRQLLVSKYNYSLYLIADHVYVHVQIGWITVLNNIPDIAMLDYLPEFLDGLFNMLSDGNREIRQAADNALGDFLKQIKQAAAVEFGPMVGILVSQCVSKEKFNRLRSLQWLHEFILLGGTRLRSFYADILGAVMYCISDAEGEISQAAKDANTSLMNLVLTTTEHFELQPIIQKLVVELSSEHVSTRVTSLMWIKMLHEKDSVQMNQNVTDLLPVLLKTLSDSADEVLVFDLNVLARISQDEVQFLRVLQALNQIFITDRALLETRGALIIRKLCALLDCKNIYITLANILVDNLDLEYVSLMVQTLNLILLTAPELFPLRQLLKDSFSNTASIPTTAGASGAITDAAHIMDGKQVFTSLFKCWCHNPVATFSLCLLAQAYDLSSLLVFKFADVDISIGFLMQVDKLIQLIESPIFLHLRLQLLDVHTKYHCELLKSLYGLLMLLPQSSAYKTLSDRLATVGSLQMHLGFCHQNGVYNMNPEKEKKKSSGVNKEFPALDYTELLARFETMQQKHSMFRLAILQQKSLLNS